MAGNPEYNPSERGTLDEAIYIYLKLVLEGVDGFDPSWYKKYIDKKNLVIKWDRIEKDRQKRKK